MVQEDKISNILPLVIRSRVICQVSASSNYRMGTSSPHAGKDHEPSRNVQVSSPLLELCSGHVAVFQVKVSQISLVRQLVDNVSEGFNFCLFANDRAILCSLARVP